MTMRVQHKGRGMGPVALRLAACAASLMAAGPGLALDLANTAWDAAAKRHALRPELLYSIALIESARIVEGQARPTLFAINSPQGARYPADLRQAARILDELLSGDAVVHPRRVDVGIMQVNVGWNGHRVGRPSDLLDPATNIMTGAAILAEAIASAPGDLALGVGRYHSWSSEAEARRYGGMVLNVYRQLLP